MYLNKELLYEIERKAKKGIVTWCIVGGLMACAFFGNLLPSNETEFSMSMAVFTAIVVVMAIVFIILDIIKKQKVVTAERINNVFENDSDGTMTINEIANATRMPKEKLDKNVMWLINKGVLKNCRFDDRDSNRIILTDVTVAKTNDFVLIHCQACGATVQTRPGQAVKCPSCGTFITASMEELLNR